MKHNPPEPERLKQDYEAEMKRLRELKAKAGDNAGGNVEESIQSIENSQLMQES